jgi:hypothetical protein
VRETEKETEHLYLNICLILSPLLAVSTLSHRLMQSLFTPFLNPASARHILAQSNSLGLHPFTKFPFSYRGKNGLGSRFTLFSSLS